MPNAVGPPEKKLIRGCIDLGSSYFRLLVAEVSTGGMAGAGGDGCARHRRDPILPIVEEKGYVGWGAALARADRAVTPGQLRTAERVLSELIECARGAGCERPRLLGTGTLRSASNAREIAGTLGFGTGLPIEVLDQRREAALGFLGASTALGVDPVGTGPMVLLDPGGTSTELSWGRGGVMEGFTGLPIGTHIVDDVLGRAERRREAARVITDAFEGGGGEGDCVATIRRLIGERNGAAVLATGGTAVSLGILKGFAGGEIPHAGGLAVLTAGDLDLFERRLAALRRRAATRRLPLERERTALLLAGVILLRHLFAETGITLARVTGRDLRWGAIMSEHSKQGAEPT